MNDYFIGIDLGGTRVKIGLVKDNEMIDRIAVPAQPADGLAASLPVITNHINQLLKNNGIALTALQGVSLGFPGLVDPYQKKILSTNDKYKDAIDLNLQQWSQEQWNAAFFIDNDARMAAIGEWKFGAGKGSDNLVVMTIGTGIGTAVIIEGKMLRGKHFQAGSLGGHFSVQYNGRQCTCGNVGCMEAYAATWSIKRMAKEDADYSESSMSQADGIDFETLFSAADARDTLAIRLQNQCLDVWAAGVVNLVHAYDPEMIVIGGGVMHNQNRILPYIREHVYKHAWCRWGKVNIQPSELLNDAAILGAVYCLQHEV